jgi:hypothetical protein
MGSSRLDEATLEELELFERSLWLMDSYELDAFYQWVFDNDDPYQSPKVWVRHLTGIGFT